MALRFLHAQIARREEEANEELEEEMKDEEMEEKSEIMARMSKGKRTLLESQQKWRVNMMKRSARCKGKNDSR